MKINKKSVKNQALGKKETLLTQQAALFNSARSLEYEAKRLSKDLLDEIADIKKTFIPGKNEATRINEAVFHHANKQEELLARANQAKHKATHLQTIKITMRNHISALDAHMRKPSFAQEESSAWYGATQRLVKSL